MIYKWKKRGNLVLVLAAIGAMVILAATLTLQITTKAKMGISLREDKKYDVDLDSAVELGKNMLIAALKDENATIIYQGDSRTPTSGYTYLTSQPNQYLDIFYDLGTSSYMVHSSGGKTKMLDLMDENLVLSSTLLNMDVDMATSSASFVGLALNDYNLVSLYTVNGADYVSVNSTAGMKTTVSMPAIEFEVKVENQNRTLTATYTLLGASIVQEILSVSNTGTQPLITAKLTTDLTNAKFNLTNISLVQNVAQTTYSAPAVFQNMETWNVNIADVSSIRNTIMTKCVEYSGYPYKMIHDEGVTIDPPLYLDCSAYVWKVYTKAGLETPLLSTRQMVNSDTWVWIPFSEIQQGDILIGVGNDRHHTVIYVGYEDGKHYVFEASNPSKLSGLSTYGGTTFNTEATVKPLDINDNMFYAYRHKSLMTQ